MGGMMSWMLLRGLVDLALLMLIITAIVHQTTATPASRPDPADEKLRRRYAAGDIDDEEYHRRRAELRQR